MISKNSFGARATLDVRGARYDYFSLRALEDAGIGNLARLPYSIRVLLENLLRHEDGRSVNSADIEFVARWDGLPVEKEINFMPARVLLQDFTGVPAVVDLAAMRDALQTMGADPGRANPLLPADLVIDHSVQVDQFGTPGAFQANALIEFQRNRERYTFLRWGQSAFRNFRVVPPDTGIVHQVNLEYLAPVVFSSQRTARAMAYPDTVVGTDSHTTMINGLGVVGWGVGGIEAEACMLGQPISMLLPPVVGFKLSGKLPRRRHRHRPGAHRGPDAAPEGRGGQVRRILRPRTRRAEPGRPRHHRQHGAPSTAPPSASSRWTRATLDYLRITNRAGGVDRAGGGLHERAGTVPHRRHARSGVFRNHANWIWAP